MQRPGMTIKLTSSVSFLSRITALCCYPVPGNDCSRYFVQFHHCLPQKGNQNLLLHQGCNQTTVFSNQNLAWLVYFKIGRFHIKYGFQDSLEGNVKFAEFLSLSYCLAAIHRGWGMAGCLRWVSDSLQVLPHLFISLAQLFKTFELWSYKWKDLHIPLPPGMLREIVLLKSYDI